jgi:hypothetical protein
MGVEKIPEVGGLQSVTHGNLLSANRIRNLRAGATFRMHRRKTKPGFRPGFLNTAEQG